MEPAVLCAEQVSRHVRVLWSSAQCLGYCSTNFALFCTQHDSIVCLYMQARWLLSTPVAMNISCCCLVVGYLELFDEGKCEALPNATRYTVVVFGRRGDSDSAQAELKFCMEKILLCPHNESAWNYMRGLLQLMKFDSTAAVTLVCQFCIKV